MDSQLAVTNKPPVSQETFDAGQILNTFSDVLKSGEARTRLGMIKIGAVAMSLKDLDSEDDQTRVALTHAISIPHEICTLQKIDGRLTNKQKLQTVGAFFGTGLGSETTQEELLIKLAIGIAQPGDLEQKDDLEEGSESSSPFRNEDTKKRCCDAARQLTVHDLIAKLKEARTAALVEFNEMAGVVSRCSTAWSNTITQCSRMYEKGGEKSKRRAKALLDSGLRASTEEFQSLPATQLKQKAWLELFTSLQPHMTAFAFGADHTTVEGLGFVEAQDDFAKINAETVKNLATTEQLNCSISTNKEKLERVKEHGRQRVQRLQDCIQQVQKAGARFEEQACKAGQNVDELKKLLDSEIAEKRKEVQENSNRISASITHEKSRLEETIKGLNHDCRQARRALENAQDSKHVASKGWFWDGEMIHLNRADEREKLSRAIERLENQIKESQAKLENVEPNVVKRWDPINTALNKEVQALLDRRAALDSDAKAAMKAVEDASRAQQDKTHKLHQEFHEIEKETEAETELVNQTLVDLQSKLKQSTEEGIALESQRQSKLEIVENIQAQIAQSLSETGACTMEQARASLLASQNLATAMGQTKLSPDLPSALQTEVQLVLELAKFATDEDGDQDDFQEFAQEAVKLNDKALMKFWKSIVRVEADPSSYDDQMQYLKDRFAQSFGPRVAFNIAEPTPMLKDVSAKPTHEVLQHCIDGAGEPTTTQEAMPTSVQEDTHHA